MVTPTAGRCVPTGAKTGRPGILKLPEALVQEATAVVPGDRKSVV